MVNSYSPGPEIRLKPNTTSWIRVYNDMPDQNLTMHWHGLSQVVAPFSDGTPLASQWPIPPLHFFDYELHPTVDESGTYFYHSHVGFQANSVAGPLIVEDLEGYEPPYSYSAEQVIFLSEYYNKTDKEITTDLVSNPFVWSNEAAAFLLNGQSPAAVNQSNPPHDGESCGPAIIQVEADKIYRFRFIGGMALTTMAIAIESHPNLTVIGADGSYTQPTNTDHIQISSGQRYDTLLHTLSQGDLGNLNKRAFWIQIEPRFRPSKLVSYACLSYNGSSCGALPVEPVLQMNPEDFDYLEYKLAPLSITEPFPTPDQVTHRVTLTTAQLLSNSSSYSVLWKIGNNTWYEFTPPSPWLVDIYKYGQSAVAPNLIASTNNSYVSNETVYAVPLGAVVKVVWLNEPNGEAGGFDVHPLHAHGRHFFDLGSGFGPSNATENDARIAAMGHVRMKRDTTIIYKYTLGDDLTSSGIRPYSVQGWRAWRFKVTDPGVWMVHCHSLQHMVMGMQTVWVMGDAEQIIAGPLGSGRLPEDLNGYLEYGGSAYGNSTYDPLVNHFY